jgi:type IV pilus assembly protein PilY1
MGTERICAYDAQSDSFRFRDVVSSIRPSEATLSEVEPGWKIYLSDGERVISRPAAVGGLLDFLTYKPDADPCAYDGETFLYSVAHATGLAPARIAIRAPDMTSGTSGVVTVHKSVRLGIGAPPTGDAILFRSSEDGSENADVQKSIQIATGLIAEAENRPLFSVVSRIVHWLKK